MPAQKQNIQFQADHHPIVFDGTFNSLSEYCLHLLHQKGYEEAASMAAGKNVLDLGCNNGYGTAILKEVCGGIAGLDVSPAAIADARTRYGAHDMDFQLYDGKTIPFENRSFDMAVSFQVIEHVEDTRSYLAEIARVLKPGGIALFTTPNAAIRLDPGMKPWNKFHVREYRAPELADALRPTFGDVVLRGLFASDDLYKIEFERCQNALKSARRAALTPPPTLKSRLCDLGKKAVKSALPEPVVNFIHTQRNVFTGRNTPSPQPAPQPLNGAVLNTYSTKDLFYREEGFEKALDLMAVCEAV